MTTTCRARPSTGSTSINDRYGSTTAVHKDLVSETRPLTIYPNVDKIAPQSTKACKDGSNPSAKDHHINPAWGRDGRPSWTSVAGSLAIMMFCPLIVLATHGAIHHSNGSILNFLLSLELERWIPQYTVQSFAILAAWILFQAVLYVALPGQTGYGQPTPAGHTLLYKVNGLNAWICTHALFLYGAYVAHWWEPSIIAKNFGGFLIAANVYGYLLTLFSYAKAHLAPSHPEDRKFSGSFIYDLYMGIEFNPRFGDWFDFKLFHNGRPGIVAWTLINISFAAYQYEKFGYYTNSMIIVNVIQALYVVDFFYNEDWYLRTIDIAHDHFGFYLSWGDSVWLPFTYTLQAQYLAMNPHQLDPTSFKILMSMGLFGYYLFRAVNYQKDKARKSNGDCLIWGKKAEVIRAQYTTSDGQQHQSILLCSGWWGLVRHANYTGDLMLSFAACAACGTRDLIPWTYMIFITTLLVHRTQRDQQRCAQKYGKYWEEYTKRVPYSLIPGIY